MQHELLTHFFFSLLPIYINKVPKMGSNHSLSVCPPAKLNRIRIKKKQKNTYISEMVVKFMGRQHKEGAVFFTSFICIYFKCSSLSVWYTSHALKYTSCAIAKFKFQPSM